MTDCILPYTLGTHLLLFLDVLESRGMGNVWTHNINFSDSKKPYWWLILAFSSLALHCLSICLTWTILFSPFCWLIMTYEQYYILGSDLLVFLLILRLQIVGDVAIQLHQGHTLTGIELVNWFSVRELILLRLFGAPLKEVYFTAYLRQQ